MWFNKWRKESEYKYIIHSPAAGSISSAKSGVSYRNPCWLLWWCRCRWCSSPSARILRCMWTTTTNGPMDVERSSGVQLMTGLMCVCVCVVNHDFKCKSIELHFFAPHRSSNIGKNVEYSMYISCKGAMNQHSRLAAMRSILLKCCRIDELVIFKHNHHHRHLTLIDSFELWPTNTYTRQMYCVTLNVYNKQKRKCVCKYIAILD